VFWIIPSSDVKNLRNKINRSEKITRSITAEFNIFTNLDAQAIIAGAVIVPGYREERETVNDSKTQMLVDYLAKRIAEGVNLMH